jgi:hypothetical protein
MDTAWRAHLCRSSMWHAVAWCTLDLMHASASDVSAPPPVDVPIPTSSLPTAAPGGSTFTHDCCHCTVQALVAEDCGWGWGARRL